MSTYIEIPVQYTTVGESRALAALNYKLVS